MVWKPCRVLAVLVGVVSIGLGVPVPANAATSQASILTLDRVARGSAVQATTSVTCDPTGPSTITYLAVSIWQGSYARKNYVEGFGGIVDPTQPRIICDGQAHEQSFTITPLRYYADQRFNPGPATAEYQVIRCTEVEPDNFFCEGDGVVRVRVKIRP